MALTIFKKSLLARSTTAAIMGTVLAASGQSSLAASLALEEIVVTATKNLQTVNDLGIAMTAMTGSQLQEMGVSSVNDLQDFAPNLSIKNEFGGNQAVFDIRGVSLSSYDTANSSPVATYFDEVAAPYPVMTQGMVFDVERVEILRGPQGTLFGKNTTGGAVSFYSAKPSEEFSASITGEVGNYDLTKVEGHVSGPLSDTFGARLAFTHTDRGEGWLDNASGGDDFGEIDRSAARLSFRYMPTDELVIDLIANYSRDESDMTPTTNLSDIALPYGSFGWGGVDTIVPASTDDRATSSGINGDASGLGYAGGPLLSRDRPSSDNEGKGVILRVEWEGDDYVLTSVTGASTFDRNDVSDWDGTVYRVQDTEYKSEIDAFSQELRLSYVGGEDYSWILGAYFAKDEVDEFFRSDCSESPTICFMTAFDTTFEQEAETAAVFTHTEWDFSEDFKLTVGLRYTNEKRDLIDAKTTTPAGFFTFPTAMGGFGYDDPTRSLTGTLAPDFSSATGILDCLVFGTCPSYGVPYNEKTDEGEWSGKVGVDWFTTPDLLIYGHVSRGFKSGGFAGVPASTTEQYKSYDAETMIAYEVGFKATLAEGAAQLNGNVFFYDYSDRQVLSTIPDPVFGPLTAYLNAPETEIYGAELELQWRPMEGLDVRQAIGYTTGEFKEFIDLDAPATLADPMLTPVYKDRAGDDVPGSEIQYSGVISYEWEIIEGIAGRGQIDYGYEDEYQSLNGDGYELESRWLVNAQFSLLESNDKQWMVTLWGKNLGDKEYYSNKNFYNEASITATPGMARTYGLRATYNWM